MNFEKMGILHLKIQKQKSYVVAKVWKTLCAYEMHAFSNSEQPGLTF